jgi:hypothetical protein
MIKTPGESRGGILKYSTNPVHERKEVRQTRSETKRSSQKKKLAKRTSQNKEVRKKKFAKPPKNPKELHKCREMQRNAEILCISLHFSAFVKLFLVFRWFCELLFANFFVLRSSFCELLFI